MKPAYRRMLQVMKEKSAGDSVAEKDWGVYIVRCSDNSFYTGATNDVKARLLKHNSGKGAAYTRTRRPVRLLYKELGMTRSQALVREAEIKSLPRGKKKILVKAGPP